MNAPFTPFSGLSLIIHLLVIWFSSLTSLFVWKKEKKVIESALTLDTIPRRVFKYGVSALIIISISAVMLASFVIALTTGLREGSREWQVRYIKNEYAYVRDTRIQPLAHSFHNWFQDIQFEQRVNATTEEQGTAAAIVDSEQVQAEEAPLVIHMD